MQQTVAQAKRQREDGPAPGARVKPARPLSLVRLLVGWLQLTARLDPSSVVEHIQGACWLSLGHFRMLRRSELPGTAAVRECRADGRGWRCPSHCTQQNGSAGSGGYAAYRSQRVGASGYIVAAHLGRAVAQGAGQTSLSLQGKEATGVKIQVSEFEKGDFTRRLRALVPVVELRAVYPHVAGRRWGGLRRAQPPPCQGHRGSGGLGRACSRYSGMADGVTCSPPSWSACG